MYLQERILDIQDVTSQLIASMYGSSAAEKQPQLADDAICVADNLPPSQFIALDKRRVKGLVLAHGGATSHTVILARSFGIPCVTGIPDIHRTVAPAEDVILDADRGFLIRTPSERVARFYARETEKLERMKAQAAPVRRPAGSLRRRAEAGDRRECGIPRRSRRCNRERGRRHRTVPDRDALHGQERAS